MSRNQKLSSSLLTLGSLGLVFSACGLQPETGIPVDPKLYSQGLDQGGDTQIIGPEGLPQDLGLEGKEVDGFQLYKDQQRFEVRVEDLLKVGLQLESCDEADHCDYRVIETDPTEESLLQEDKESLRESRRVALKVLLLEGQALRDQYSGDCWFTDRHGFQCAVKDPFPKDFTKKMDALGTALETYDPHKF